MLAMGVLTLKMGHRIEVFWWMAEQMGVVSSSILTEASILVSSEKDKHMAKELSERKMEANT